jgi:7-keto-8-aminopelargonate synthetase-like enzyme
VLIDEKAHPSLADAAQFFDCPILKFKHRDEENLSRVVSRIGKNAKPILLTDGMFSHDGSIAPLDAYLKILPRDSMLLADDAHGAGTLGTTGKGTPELEKISRRRIIQTITLSKAFGVYGGAILGSDLLREKILARSRMFVGSTPLPLPLANAALASIDRLKSRKNFRERLERNVKFVKTELRKSGREIVDSPSPIFPIVPNSSKEADFLKSRCLKRGIFPSFIKYPGGPENGYFRFAISSEHTREQLSALVAAMRA